MTNGYTLVICEKPDAARRVYSALSEGKGESTVVEGTAVFRFSRGGTNYVVCSAQGHVYGTSDPLGERTVYPVFDVEWYPSDMVGEGSKGASKRISAIKKLAGGATGYVNACDYDVEGETIGYNVLRYACGGKEGAALRAKFSTLTDADLKGAFDDMGAWSEGGLAVAGRARHLIDFVWGVNLSRALSQAALGAGGGYRTVTMGRVQGPALGFVVKREREIRGFVPVPYWKASGTFVKGKVGLNAAYSQERIGQRAAAQSVREDCESREAVVKTTMRKPFQVRPPSPFNIGDLQREAYAAFRLPPNKTLRVAERLYLDALISYPRTGSQKLPPTIGYRNIIRRLGEIPTFAAAADELLSRELRPSQGTQSDPAHPAIHPTGERPRRRLDGQEADLFDLIVRRFLASFGPPAQREEVAVSLAVADHTFNASGQKTLSPGWTKYYGRYSRQKDVELPALAEGERLLCREVVVEDKFEQRPPRFTQSSLLQKMEAEGIGTKATRADIIATLVSREYVSKDPMEVSDVGFSVAEAMERYAKPITSTELTREIEWRLEEAEGGGGEKELLRDTVRTVAKLAEDLSANEETIGKSIGPSRLKRDNPSLGGCPVCGTGKLRVVRSRTTKKRFVGCSNYPAGCRASGPLPQRGTIAPTSKRCTSCSWPIIYVRGRGRPWRLCVNPRCPEKRKP